VIIATTVQELTVVFLTFRTQNVMSKGGGKGKVGFSKPPEPKFIRELKAQVGYKEPVGLEAKFNGDGGGMEDREDRDDEKPTIVVLREGDLTEEEVKVVEEKEKEEIEKIPADGRIMFKKPTKREHAEKDKNDSDKSKKHKKIKKEVKLLSFDEDEEDL